MQAMPSPSDEGHYEQEETQSLGERLWGWIWLLYTGYLIANIFALWHPSDRIAFMIPTITNSLHIGFVVIGAFINKYQRGSYNPWAVDPWWIFAGTDVVLSCVVVLCVVCLLNGTDTTISVGVNVVSLGGVVVCFWKTYKLYRRSNSC